MQRDLLEDLRKLQETSAWSVPFSEILGFFFFFLSSSELLFIVQQCKKNEVENGLTTKRIIFFCFGEK